MEAVSRATVTKLVTVGTHRGVYAPPLIDSAEGNGIGGADEDQWS